jgi:glyoxylase-like metal-dependent hydrolase (beta-lactamase superfamily II)
MRVHHLNCGAMQPYGGALWDGQTPGFGAAVLACHCLLLEYEAGDDGQGGGLVLVDTGVASLDPHADRARQSPFFLAVDRCNLDPMQSAAARIRALGRDPADVRQIVMTHLDFDHASGLPDFPGAAIHLSAAEARHAQDPHGPIAQMRYRPAMWSGARSWRTYGGFPDSWFGLPAARLDGVPGEILLVSLPGHTKGHCGVAIRTRADGEGGTPWLLHVGDAIFNHRELHPGKPGVPTLARAYQWFMQESQVRRRRSLHALQDLVRHHGKDVRVVCTHDPSLLPVEQLPAPG